MILPLAALIPSGRHIGHPQGHLQSIYYVGYFSGMSEQHGHILQNLLMNFDDEYGLLKTHENEYCFPLLPDRFNWSTIDIDACSIQRVFSM